MCKFCSPVNRARGTSPISAWQFTEPSVATRCPSTDASNAENDPFYNEKLFFSSAQVTHIVDNVSRIPSRVMAHQRRHIMKRTLFTALCFALLLGEAKAFGGNGAGGGCVFAKLGKSTASARCFLYCRPFSPMHVLWLLLPTSLNQCWISAMQLYDCFRDLS